MNVVYEYVAVISLALAAGVVGAFALLKRMTLASDVVSHMALPGIGIALVYHLNPLLGAAATLAVGTLLVWGLERKTGLATEAMIGVVFAASLAIGALITPEEELERALFGEMQPMGMAGMLFSLSACAVIVSFVLLRKPQLTLALFSRDLAAGTGVNIARTDLEFLVVFSLTILINLKLLGTLLAGALLMVPAASGRLLAKGINSALLYSSICSIVAVVTGLALTRVVPRGAGPVLVLSATAVFVLALFIPRKH